MKFLEKDLEEIIYLSDKEKLSDRGLYISGILKRQLKIGNYGIADLVTFERYYVESSKTLPYLHIKVYELKKDKIGISALLQAVRYCKGIKTYLEQKHPRLDFSMDIVLVGSEVDLSGSFVFLTDLIQHCDSEKICRNGELYNIDFYTYKYELDGINFERRYDYNLTEKGF